MAKKPAEQYGESSEVLDWLEAKRKAAGLTQAEIEARTKAMGARISQAYYSQLKNGVKKLADLSPEKMNALRTVLNISPTEWVERTGYRIVEKVESEVVSPFTGFYPVEEIPDILSAKVYPLEEAWKPLNELKPDEEFFAPVWPQQFRPGLLVFSQHFKGGLYLHYIDTYLTIPEVGQKYLIVHENEPLICHYKYVSLGKNSTGLFDLLDGRFASLEDVRVIGQNISSLSINFPISPKADFPYMPPKK